MANINLGNQEVLYNIAGTVTTDSVSKYNFRLFPTGIYESIDIIPDPHNQTVKIKSKTSNPWYFIKNDLNAKKQIKIVFYSAIDGLKVSEAAPYIVARFNLTSINRSNYAEVLALPWEIGNTTNPLKVMEDDIILGRVVYENGVLQPHVDYSKQKKVDIEYSYEATNILPVTPTEPPTNVVRIKGSNIFINGTEFIVEDQAITIPPVVNARMDLVYMDRLGVISVESGTDDQINPTIPQVPPECYPIAMITRSSASLVVSGADISQIPIEKYIFIPAGVGSEGERYTNLNPTPITIGGIEAGTTFEDWSVTQVFDTLFYPYQAPSFSAFTINSVANTVEVGYTVPAVKVFSWTTINNGNINESTISLRDVTGNQWIFEDEMNSGTYTDIGIAVTRSSIASYTWRIQGVNSKLVTFTRDFTVSWRFMGYYGESSSASLLEADAKALRVGSLVSGIAGTYNFLAGGYKYLVFPEDYTPTSFTDVGTNLNVPMTSSSLSITNSFGVVKNYNVYRTTNIIGSAISIRVV